MDRLHPDFLSRDEIIAILNERYLNIPDIESLPYDELSRIYKTFAVPLERREPKRAMDAPPPAAPPIKRPFVQDLLAHTIVMQNYLQTPHTSSILQQTKYLKLSYNSFTNSTGQKRRNSIAAHHTKEATPAKRPTVPWLLGTNCAVKDV